MEHHLPDVVPARAGAPGGLLGGYSLDGLLEVRSMPGLFLVGFIQQREHQLCGIHGASSRASHEKLSRRGWRARSMLSTSGSLAVQNSSRDGKNPPIFCSLVLVKLLVRRFDQFTGSPTVFGVGAY